MKLAVLDVETSMKPILHPWMRGSYLSTVGLFIAKPGIEPYYKDWVFTHKEWEGTHGIEIHNIYAIQEELEDIDILIGHNVKFDINWLSSINVVTSHTQPWCTQMVEFFLRGQDKSVYGPGPQQDLSNTCRLYGLPVKTDMVKTYWDAGINTADIPLRILLPYQKNDVMITAELFKKQWAQLKTMPKLKTLCDVRNKALHIMSDLELNGMPIDRETADMHVSHFQEELDGNNIELQNLFGIDDININSGPELSACLFGGALKRTREKPLVYTRNCTLKEPYRFTYKSGKLKGQTVTKFRNRAVKELTCKKIKEDYEIDIAGVGFVPGENTETTVPGVYQTNTGVLKSLKVSGDRQAKADQRRVLEILLHRSKINQFISTFVGAKSGTGLFYNISLNSDGRAHPNYNQTATVTARLSSSNPNGQNFTRSKEDEDGFSNPLKSVFVPSRPGGMILVIDLSQLEWRVGAWLSQDPVAMREILDGVDIHLDNATKMFGDAKYRQDAKIMTFRLLYGGGAYAFWKDPKMPNFSQKKWNNIVDAYNRKYCVLSQWQERNIRFVADNHGVLYSPLGRIYTIPQVPHRKYPGVMVYLDTAIKNYPVQGTATGDIVPLAMNMIQERIDSDPIKFMSSHWMGQVHDSVIFDTMPHEVKRMAYTGISVFEDLPERISKLWGVDFNVPLTGEATWGPTYGYQCNSVVHDGGKWILKTK